MKYIISIVIFLAITWIALKMLLPSVYIGANPDRDKVRAMNTVVVMADAAKSYYDQYGTPLIGEKRSILRTLQGDNPKKIAFLEIDPKYLSKNGLYIDPWGTPYIFDFTNPSHPRVYSCGKNKIDEGGYGDDYPSWTK